MARHLSGNNGQVSEDAEHFVFGRSIEIPTEFEIKMHLVSSEATID